MTDTSGHAGLETETPVNPYSLLEAVNNSSDTAHTGWLIFIAIMAYLTIAVAGVSHRDLLLETPVALPIMQVSIQQAQFFKFAPVILLLFHLGVISQLVLLARKTLEFDHAVRALEVTDRRNHPLRLELHNFFFVQAVAGPHRSAVMSAFLHGMAWLTLVILPVILLLYIQINFLPYHDVGITWVHRVCLVVDILMLVLIGIFLLRLETSFFSAFWRVTIGYPFSFMATTALMAVVAFFSFFVATVPGESLDRITRLLTGGARQPAAEIGRGGRDTRAEGGFRLPFFPARVDGTLWGMFHRNLVVTDSSDLFKLRDLTGDDATVNLRGRDLRFARLDRTDLRRADMTGADLEGASFVNADLSNAKLGCADISELLLTEDRERARCTEARRANFTRAKLSGARMSGIDLRDALLDEASLEGAEMAYAIASGASFGSARLDKVDLTGGVQLVGANFLIASLQGADLTGAQLQGADLSSASLQGAILFHANLAGASLRDADLEGADMQSTVLQGANLANARVRATDFRYARVWMTTPPARDSVVLVDMTDLALKPLDDEEVKSTEAAVARVDTPRIKALAREAVEAALAAGTGNKWAGTPEQLTWNAYAGASRPAAQEGYARQLTDHLGNLMCKSRWVPGAVATGVVKRALGQEFRGNASAIYERLRSRDCPAGEGVAPRLIQRLSAAVDQSKGN